MAAALYASQITRAKGFCPMTAANAVVEETNFGTCHSAATVCYLVRAAHELRTRTGNFGPAERSKLFPAAFLQRGNAGKSGSAGANIESRTRKIITNVMRAVLAVFVLLGLLCRPGRNRRPLTRIVEGRYNDAKHSDTLRVLI